MNQLKKARCYTSILSAIKTLMLVLLLSGANVYSALAQQTPSEALTKDEREIAEQLKAGGEFDANKKEISAQFLMDLLKQYSSQESRPAEKVHIQNAVVSGKLNLKYVTIPYSLFLEDCVFNDDVDFSYGVFEKPLSLRGSIFKGAANFYKVKVDGDFRVNKAQFLNREKQVNFDSINVSGDFYFYNTVVEGPFTLSESVLHRLECTETQFKNNEARFTDNDGQVQPLETNANFFNIKVNGMANFTRSSFAGSANFESIDIGNDLEMSDVHFDNPAKTIQFFSMNVGRNAFFNHAEFAGGFDMSIAKVGGYLEFNGTKANNPHQAKTFSGMKVDTAIFAPEALVPPYSLQDIEYRRLNPDMDYQGTLGLINNSEYSPSAFTNLEAYYKRAGMEEAANAVYFDGKAKESKVGGWFTRFSNWFLWITVGYGKRPWQALIWSLLFIGIGRAIFFRQENMMIQKREDKARYRGKYNPLWYSVALFLPIVELEDVKIWAPKPKRRCVRHYMRAHIILGYLLIPIGLAAWTGLIK